MNINPINPVNFVANQPGQSVQRQIVVTGIDAAVNTETELTVTVTSAGNGQVGTPVLVAFDPEDPAPSGTVSVPPDAGVTASISEWSPAGSGADAYWYAFLTITTV